MERFFPAGYRLLRPGAAQLDRPPYDGPLRFAFCAQEERQALRLFLRALRRLPDDSFQLVLAGHMHDGQITVPLPRGKLRLAHPRAPFAAGVYRRDGVQMHV